MNINPSINLKAAMMSFNNITMAIKTNNDDDDGDEEEEEEETSRCQVKRSTKEIFHFSSCCYLNIMLIRYSFNVLFLTNKFIQQMKW